MHSHLLLFVLVVAASVSDSSCMDGSQIASESKQWEEKLLSNDEASGEELSERGAATRIGPLSDQRQQIQAEPLFEYRLKSVTKLLLDGQNANLSSLSNSVYTLMNNRYAPAEIVSVADSGIDPNNCLLSEDVVDYYFNFFGPTCSEMNGTANGLTRCGDRSDSKGGHGSFMTAIIAGRYPQRMNTTVNSIVKQYTGISRSARIVFTDIGDSSGNINPPTDLKVMLTRAYNAGARIHLNAWGCNSASTTSSSAASCLAAMQQLNEFAATHPDMLIITPAPESRATSTTADLSDAKNVLTVGATMSTNSGMKAAVAYMDPNVQIPAANPSQTVCTVPSCTLDHCCQVSATLDCCSSKYTSSSIRYENGSLASFTPTGITAYKPELLGVGAAVISAWSDGSGVVNGTGDNMVKASSPLTSTLPNSACQATPPLNSTSALYSISGTSVAAASIAGAATVVREYLTNGYATDGRADLANSRNPSASMLKALLLTSAMMEALKGTDQGGSNAIGDAPNLKEGFGRPVLRHILWATPVTSGGVGVPETYPTFYRLFLDDFATEGGISKYDTKGITYNLTQVTATSTNPLILTLVWTDSKSGNLIENTIYHPLEMSIVVYSNINSANPSAPQTISSTLAGTATTIRQAIITNAIAATVRVTIAPGNDFADGLQTFSLVARGNFGPQACQPPRTTPFTCQASDWNPFLLKSPAQWQNIRGGIQQLPTLFAVPQSCRHCVWSLFYPRANPLVIAAPINCSSFVDYFYAVSANVGSASYLSLSEFSLLFFQQTIPVGGQAVANPFGNYNLISKGLMNDSRILFFTDLNSDEVLSLSEWQAIAHFWAPLILSRTGPTPTSTTSSVLGGFYFDRDAWAVWLQAAITIQEKLFETDTVWRKKLRAPRDGEVKSSFDRVDLDKSNKISFDEHYFVNFADLNGDNLLCTTEFHHALYISNTKCPRATCFAQHDLNKDGTVEYLERKFVMADYGRTQTLSVSDWNAADYPAEAFSLHDMDNNGAIPILEYLRYMAFYNCSGNSGEVSSKTWSCPIALSMEGKTPYISFTKLASGELNVDGATAGAVLTLFGDLGWSIKYITNSSSAQSDLKLFDAHNLETLSFTTVMLGVFSSADTTLDSSFVCSDSLGLEDGYTVLSMADAPVVQLERLIPVVLISPSFVQFVCSMFLACVFVGFLFWISEYRTNNLFSKTISSGIWDGIYMALVTVATVGFGDVVCKTGIGRVFASLWMLVGIVSFGILTGEIATNINERKNAGIITGIDSLAGLSVAQLRDPLGGASLHIRYGYSATNVDTMQAAIDLLLSGDVKAIVAPNPLIISYFDQPENNYRRYPCENPFAIKGGIFSEKPMNKICAASSSGYAGKYLINAINSARQSSLSTGVLQRVINNALSVDGSGEECKEPNPYDVAILVATAVGVGLLGAAAAYAHIRSKRKLQRDFRAQAIRLLERIRVTRDDRIRRFALHWLRVTRAHRSQRVQQARVNEARLFFRLVGLDIDTKARALFRYIRSFKEKASTLDNAHTSVLAFSVLATPLGAIRPKFSCPPDIAAEGIVPLVEEMRASISELRMVAKTLSTDMHSLNKEAFDHRTQLHNVVRFFTMLNGFSLLAVAIVCLGLLITWGSA